MEIKHPLTAFQENMQELQQLVLDLGDLALENLEKTLKAFSEKDAELANQVIESSDSIIKMERAVDHACLLIVTRMDPKSTDLRYVLSCGKVASDLERIAEYAVSIAKRVECCSAADYQGRLWYVKTMGETLVNMMKAILVAFKEMNVEKALDVWHADNEVDAIFKEALSGMNKLSDEDIGEGKGFISLISTLRGLERVGDHMTNISEHIYFIKYGDYFPGKK